MTAKHEPDHPAQAAAAGQPVSGDAVMRDEHLKVLADAFEKFTETTRAMEEAYWRLQARVEVLDKELAERNRELELTFDYLNNILESMSDGVIATDTAGVVTAFNRAASNALGYAREEVIGRRFPAVFGRPFTSPGGLAGGFQTKDGRTITIAERDTPLADRTHQRIGAVKVFQDVTEVAALRERVRQQDRLAALGQMAATVAHEIRNPLGGIRGFAALLARDIAPDDARRRLVDKIEIGAKDLERVVSELLEFTRPMELRQRPTVFADLVDSTLGYLTLEGRAITLVNEIDPALQGQVDQERMRQVFLNILLNAVQSVGRSGEVRVASEISDSEIVIAVRDTGCGIPPAQIDQVFSPFYTTKEKGTGLGLAVAAKIVEGHGGRIEVESNPGAGSCFRIRLPRMDVTHG